MDRRPGCLQLYGTDTIPNRTKVDDFHQIEHPRIDMIFLRTQLKMREWFEPRVMPEPELCQYRGIHSLSKLNDDLSVSGLAGESASDALLTTSSRTASYHAIVLRS
jgi:hypothetical protein